MNQRLRLFGLLFLSIFILSNCVSTKKYEELRADKNETEMERDSLRRAYDERRYVEFNLKRTEAELKNSKENLSDLTMKYNALDQSYKDLLKRYDEILDQNSLLLSNSSSEKQELMQELSNKQLALDQKERELRNLADELKAKEESINNVTVNYDEYEKKINELQAALSAKDESLKALRTRINQALLGFSDTDLTISESNGKIYVSLSQDLLFAPGSDQIDWKGKKALQSIADVLKRYPDIEINVEGHTDSDGTPASNWDLSVRRATSVVKVLTGYGVEPTQVIASGRGPYMPLANNNSAAGKAKNRRTEIILTPNLDELYRLMNQ